MLEPKESSTDKAMAFMAALCLHAKEKVKADWCIANLAAYLTVAKPSAQPS
jgi:hypothetical protein